MREIWKDIAGYEELYQVSNLGRIKSIKTNKILKSRKGNIQYLTVDLTKNHNKKRFLIHRLVAESFIDNPLNKDQVNHIDCNKINNKIDNLEWCTRSENMKHAYKNNLLFMPCKGINGYKNEKSKTTLQYDTNGKFIKEWGSSHLASENLNIHYGNICTCCRGKRKTAGGYVWRYKENE